MINYTDGCQGSRASVLFVEVEMSNNDSGMPEGGEDGVKASARAATTGRRTFVAVSVARGDCMQLREVWVDGSFRPEVSETQRVMPPF